MIDLHCIEEESRQHRFAIHVPETPAGAFGLIVKGYLLTIVTLGFYRYWYLTEIRKYIWSRTTIDGSPLEYTGTGFELLLGVLIATAVMVPIYLGCFVVLVMAAAQWIAPVISVVGLLVLKAYARYRSRQYLASRTRWRGIGVSVDGSAWAYAGRTFAWWCLVILSFGLAFPLMRTDLERYEIRRTSIGGTRLQSSAVARSLITTWLVICGLAAIPPVVLFIGPALHTIAALPPGQASKFLAELFLFEFALGHVDQSIADLWMNLGYSLSLTLLLIAISFPYYRAIEIKHFFESRSAGQAVIRSNLRPFDLYPNYIAYFSMLLAVNSVIIAAIYVELTTTKLINASDLFSNYQILSNLLEFVFLILFVFTATVIFVRIIYVGFWLVVAPSTYIKSADPALNFENLEKTSSGGLRDGFSSVLHIEADLGGGL